MFSRFLDQPAALAVVMAMAFVLAVSQGLAPARAMPPPAAGAGPVEDLEHPEESAVRDALRVCADPDNLPYSHRNRSGFENRLAQLVAADLDRPLQYYWQPQQRGFVRKNMGEGHCDLFIGVPADFDRLLTTRPYYRSSYVFVFRADEPKPLSTFDDPRLPGIRVGVQLVGDDLAATPPGHALARAGAVVNVVGYTVLGQGPAAARMVQAVAQRHLDAALIWGPQAGWFVQGAPVPLRMEAALAPAGLGMPFQFQIAMGVRHGDRVLRDARDEVIVKRRAQIDSILRDYGVPRSEQEAKR
jgi:mxaJ protein